MGEIDQEDIEASTLTSYMDKYIEQISKLREEHNEIICNEILKYRMKMYKLDRFTAIINILYLSLVSIMVIYFSFVISKLFILIFIIIIVFAIFVVLDFIKTHKEFKKYLKERGNSINEKQN